MNEMAKLMIFGGLAIAAVGVAMLAVGKLSGGGWLPGDVVVQRKNFTFFFPIVTCVIVSVVLTIVLNLFFRR
jgi:Protein of unknown function (DUF2905)